MTTKYGTRAYPGPWPIGPSASFVSPLGISESIAHEHPASVSDLTKLLSEPAGSGRLLWVPAGVRLSIPNTAWGKTIKSGFILAGSPGSTVEWSYYGPTTGYMVPMFNVQSDAAISGLNFKGAGGYGHYGQGAGPCGLRLSGQKRTIIENVDLSAFRGGGIWFGDGAATITRWDDDAQRNILRHVKISHIQQYGFGYGCGLQGSYQSFLIEASILEFCRHLTMSSGGTTTAYEIRYCQLGEAVYADSDKGPATIQSHQVDVHGGGWANRSYRTGKHLRLLWCDFSANDTFSEKPNVMIRGIMADGGEAIIENCWTKKNRGPDKDGAYTDTEIAGNGRIVLLAEAEGQPWKGPKSLASAGVTCRDNWYGLTDPPDDGVPPPPPASSDIRVLSVSAEEAVVGGPYTIRVLVKNVGASVGTAAVTIGWIGTGRNALKTQALTLDPGSSVTVEYQGKATTIGGWSFYAMTSNSEARTTLTVREQGSPMMELGPVSAQVNDAQVLISATVSNTGTLGGDAVVRLAGNGSASKNVSVPAGFSVTVDFAVTVEVSEQ